MTDPAMPATPATKSRKKLWFGIGGGVLAALVVAAALGVPAIQQQSRNAAYTEAIDQTVANYKAADKANTEANGLDPLTVLQLGEAVSVSAKIEALGKTDIAVIPEAQVKEIAASSKLVADALPEIDEDEQKFLDEIAASAKEGKVEETKDLPASWFGDTDELLEAVAPFAVPVEGSPQVSAATDKPAKEDVAKAEERLAESAEVLADAKAALALRTEQAAAVSDALVLALPALEDAAQALPKQATAVTEKQAKASKDQKSAVTKAATAASAESQTEDAERVIELVGQLNSYIKAAGDAKTAHDKAVANEAAKAAAAQAAASGAGGYTDPGTGNWTPVDNSWGGGGSGYVNPGTGGGGGGGGGSTGGGGGTTTPPPVAPPVAPPVTPPPATQTCPGPPGPGYYPDGGSFTTGGITCPTYAPPVDW